MVPKTNKEAASVSKPQHFFKGGVCHVRADRSLQFQGKIPESEFEKSEFSPYQNLMYKRAIYGLSVYTEQERKEMHWEKRRRIIKVQQRAQELLTSLKKQVMSSLANQWLEKFWAKSDRSNEIIEQILTTAPHQEVSQDYKEPPAEVYHEKKRRGEKKVIPNPDIPDHNKIEFKELGITKSYIIALFIEQGILPRNFYELKNDPYEKDRLPKLRGNKEKKLEAQKETL